MDSKGIGYEEEVRKAISQLREEMIGIYDQMKSYQSLLQAVHKKLEVEVLDSGDGARSEDARNAHDQFHSNVVELKREFAKVIEPNGRYDRTFKTFDLIRRVLLDPQIKETGLEVQDLKNLVVLLLRYKELMKDTLDATVGRDTPFGEGDNWDCDGTHEDTLNLRLKEWNKNYGKSSYKRNKYSSYELSKDFRTFYFEASARMAIETLAWKVRNSLLLLVLIHPKHSLLVLC